MMLLLLLLDNSLIDAVNIELFERIVKLNETGMTMWSVSLKKYEILYCAHKDILRF